MGFSNPLASIVLANAGTPLMWVGMFHLAVGNLVIGLVEGLLIAWLFKAPKLRSMAGMIGANYFSAWVGFVLLEGWMKSEFASRITIYDASRILLGGVIVAYFLTLLLEWPFVASILKKNPRRLPSSIKASLLVQTASYAVLAFFYWGASGTSILSETQQDQHFGRWANSSAWVYFISDEDNRVYRIKADGSGRELVSDRVISDEDALLVRQTEPARWAIYAVEPRDVKISEGGGFDQSREIADDLEGRVLGKFESEIEKQIRVWERTSYRWTKVFDLRNEGDFDWEARTGFWPIEGLSYRDRATGRRKRIALETPFLQWRLGYATILPRDQMIFQLGRQICIFDPATMRLGLIAFGRCPVVSVPLP